MDFGAIIDRARKAAADNAPTILTALGVTGTITTVVLASRASFKAAEILEQHKKTTDILNANEILSPEEVDEAHGSRKKIELVWKEYVPAATTGVVTVACIVMANRVTTRRAAALASAYTVSQEAFREYKDKVVQKMGEKKEQAVRDEIAQDRVKANPPGQWLILDDDVLCMDTHSGRYFESTREEIRKAENDINYKLLNEDHASLSDFWELIGLSKTADSDEIGWNVDSKFEVQYGSALTEDGKPVLTIEFRTTPIRRYYRR